LHPAFDPGRGTITFVSKANVGAFCQDSGAALTRRTCAARLPELRSEERSEVFQMVLPDALWDRVPGARESASLSDAPDPAMSFDPVTSMLGIELSDAAATWPSYTETGVIACGDDRRGVACFPDADGDGHPGITVAMRLRGVPNDTGGARCGGLRYAPMPTDASPGSIGFGASQIYVGLRMTLGGSSALGDDCNGGVGPAQADNVALRALDCTMDDGSPCTPAAATFVDEKLPVFHVLAAGETPPAAFRDPRNDVDASLDRSTSQGARQTLIRLGDSDDSIGCGDVRDAFALPTP
jgi:hypothetical protein